VPYNIEIEKIKVKLLTEYENATQKVLLYIEKDPKFPNVIKHTRRSPLHYLSQFLEWREGFLIPIFCSYDHLPSPMCKTSLQY
jgi:hypothetical protein